MKFCAKLLIFAMACREKTINSQWLLGSVGHLLMQQAAGAVPSIGGLDKVERFSLCRYRPAKRRPAVVYLGYMLVFSLSLLNPAGNAQERTAAGNLATEASWQALQSRIDATNGNVAVLRTDMNAILKCGKENKVWNGVTCASANKAPVMRMFRGVGNIGRWSACFIHTSASNGSCGVTTTKPAMGYGNFQGWTYVDKVSSSEDAWTRYYYYDYPSYNDLSEWRIGGGVRGTTNNCFATCIRYDE